MTGGLFKVLDKARTLDPADPTKPRFFDMVLWGVVSKIPKFDTRTKDGMPRIQFGVRYRKGKFVNMIVLQSSPHAYAVASRLKMGDPVLITGDLREYRYTRKGKKGAPDEPATGQDGKADIILPLRLLAAWVEQTDDALAPDALAGLEEYGSEGQREEIPW